MNKTYLSDIIRMLKKNMGRFILLSLIVAMGVSFYVGIKSSAPIMGYSVDKYNDEYKLMDLTIYSSYGFNDDDVKAIEGIDENLHVYGRNFIDVLTVRDGTKVAARIHNLSDEVNKVKLVDGRLPETVNECVVEEKQLLASGFEIGDIIEVENDNLDDFLKVDRFKVVGIINTPYYLNDDKGYSTLNNRILATYLYVNEDVFINDFYTEIAVTFDNDLISFNQTYKDKSEKIKKEIETLAKTQVRVRKEIVLKEAYDKYNEGKEEYEDGKNEYDIEIAKAEKEIADAKVDIVQGEKNIRNGYKELAENKADVERKLLDAEIKINDERNGLGVKEAELEQARSEFAAKKTELEANINQIDNGISQIDNGIAEAGNGISALEANIANLNAMLTNVNNALAMDPANMELLAQKAQIEGTIENLNGQLISTREMLNNLNIQKNELLSQRQMINSGIIEAETKIGDGYSQIQYGYQALTNAAVELEENRKKSEEEFLKAEKDLLKAEKDLKQAKIDLEEAIITFEREKADNLLELEKAKADLDKALQDIEELEDGEWTVLDRSLHYASKTFNDTLSQMSAIANVFPVFFFIVASLVCLTTMSRMVDEERGQIGIYRAIGYSKNKIYLKYLLYAGVATVIGCVLGNIIGIMIFPPVIYEAWGMMYIMPEYRNFIPYNQMIISNIAFMIIILGTTLYSCISDTREVPASLLRPKAQKIGKKVLLEKIGFIWNNLGFTSKVTARNIFRYKNRFIMTILGIGGCTALLLTGLGIRDSISAIIPHQYETIYKHNAQIILKDDLSNSDVTAVFSDISKRSEEAVLASSYSTKVIFNNNDEVATVNVFDKDDISKVIRLKTRNVDNNLTLDDSGVIINEKLAELLKIKVNDIIKMESFNGLVKEVRVSAITEMYVYHSVFISEQLYKNTFGTSKINNDIFIQTNEDIKDLQEELLKDERIDSVVSYDAILDNFNDMISGLNAVVYVILVASASLAILVLSNLTSINIAERMREIATLKVLGFTSREVNNYIYRENLFLTIIGSVFGIPMGMVLHGFIISLVEMDEIMFGRNVSLLSVFIAVGFTLVCSNIVNVMMSNRLKKINMIESLKSVE